MSKHSVGSRHFDKCGHGRCKCLVVPGLGYCSGPCERADIELERSAHDSDNACTCGHPDCKQMQSPEMEKSRQTYVR